MNEYNISAFITIMKGGLAEDNTQEAAGRLLLNSIAQHDLTLVDVDGKMVTNLVKQKAEVHEAIKNAAANPAVIAATISYFDNVVVPKLNPHTVDDTCLQILKLLERDKTVPGGKYQSLLNFYNCRNTGEFLAMCLLYAVSRPNKKLEAPVDYSDLPLLSEVDNECPLCHSPLVKTIKGVSVKKYSIVRIFPEGLDDDTDDEFCAARTPAKRLDSNDNKIALCNDCAEAYEFDQELDEYVRLFDLKEDISHSYSFRQEIAEMDLEDEINEIVAMLTGLKSTTSLQNLEMNALCLEQKIRPENAILRHALQEKVLTYYRFIEDTFSRVGNFNLVASEIKLIYEKLETHHLSQDEIYSQVANQIYVKTKNGFKHRLASDIIAAFFVQNCEVFREITK